MSVAVRGFVVAAIALAALPQYAGAQALDLSHGGPIAITSVDGIEWRQADREVIARGQAKAVRGNVTVTADRLIAWYRKKAGADGQPATGGAAPQPAAAPPAAGQPMPQGSNQGSNQASNQGSNQASNQGSNQASNQGSSQASNQGSSQASGAQPAAQPGQPGATGVDADTAGNEVYRLQAEGTVHIFTPTDLAVGDLATYDIDQSVLVLTGRNLKLTTPNDVLTARDDLEYWSAQHMAVARGDAVVVTKDGRRLAGDTLVAYTDPTPATPTGGAAAAAPSPKPATTAAAKPDPNADPLTSSGKLKKVEAFGNVSVRTVTDTVTGDRAVYVPETGIARVLGSVLITRGQNQLAGSEAIVNMKTGVSHLLAGNAGRVQGLLVPNDQTNNTLVGSSGPPAKPVPPKPATQGRK